MIDPEKETIVQVSQAHKHLPQRGDKPLHRSTFYRWIMKGLHGVRLETCYVGGIHCTSIEALRRFDAAVTAAKLGPTQAGDSSTLNHSRAHEAAKRKLAASA